MCDEVKAFAVTLVNIRVENREALFVGPHLLPDVGSWKEACLLVLRSGERRKNWTVVTQVHLF